jgi:ribosome-binding protein aMBF1 (putative translation factor)
MQDDSLPDHRPGYQWRPTPGRRSTPTCPHAKRTPELHVFGRAIRELRARRDLSQEELGFRSDLHRNYVGAIERGEINPTFRVLLKLERGLAMPLSERVEKYESHRAPLELFSPSPRPPPLGPARTHDR